jgi:adenylate cyclase class 2
MEYAEIEVRFLEVNKNELIQRLKDLNAVDLGEKLLDERIIYDNELTWRDGGEKILRLRSVNGVTELAYKERKQMTVDGVEEVEFTVSNADAAEVLLSRLGYSTYRYQQKKRHSFQLGEVTIDIDTWPNVPTYVELEGKREDDLKKVAQQLGFNWDDVELRSPREIIEQTYNIPVGNMKWFTFDKFE